MVWLNPANFGELYVACMCFGFAMSTIIMLGCWVYSCIKRGKWTTDDLQTPD